MKKLSVVMAALLVASGAVMAQDPDSSTGGSGAGTIGGVATGTVVAGAIAVGVIASVVSNNRSDSAPDEVEEVPSCQGTDPLVGGVCVGTTSTVTATGTGTATGTITVPVTFTYAPTLQ